MWERIKSFCQRHNNAIWVIVIIIIVLVISGDLPMTYSQKVAGNYPMNDVALLEESYGLGAPASRTGIVPPSDGYSESGMVVDQDPKIRKSGYLNLEVAKEDYGAVKSNIDVLIGKHKGFYVNKNESAHTYNQADYHTYSISIKFPKDSFDSALEELKSLGEVKNFNIDASDVTAQYYDIVAYKEAAEKVRDRIQVLLGQTQNINDIISIESKLADLQRQIDSYQQQLANMDRQTEYSQVSVTVTEKLGYTESFYEMTKLRDLFKNMVNSIDQVFVKFSRVFGYLLLILIIWGIYKVVRKIRLRRKQKLSN